MDFNPSDHPHVRYNPLKDEWILVSPHRMKRPWSGQVEKPSEEENCSVDFNNPLCPLAKRGNGEINLDYKSTFVFTNDFPALKEESIIYKESDGNNDSSNDLLQCKPVTGTCRVLCYHPKSDVTLALMTISEIKLVIEAWIEQVIELGIKYEWVQIFENRGAMMGCSNPHPHCQVWASDFLPNEISIKDRTQKTYFDKNNRPMLVDYVKLELEKKEIKKPSNVIINFPMYSLHLAVLNRNLAAVTIENDSWICVVPYWAIWPFETMLLPKRHIKQITELIPQEIHDLASILSNILIKYDNLFETSFPYCMGWHGAPTGTYAQNDNSHWQLHAMFLPPLLRSASVRKFMVGYEMFAQPQRDLTAEQAAARLASLSHIHYKHTKGYSEVKQ